MSWKRAFSKLSVCSAWTSYQLAEGTTQIEQTQIISCEHHQGNAWDANHFTIARHWPSERGDSLPGHIALLSTATCIPDLS